MLPPKKNSPDYYSILGIKPDSSKDQIKDAYRKMAKEVHPDNNDAADAEDQFRLLSEAYEILNNPLSKKDYDLKNPDVSKENKTPSAKKTQEKKEKSVKKTSKKSVKKTPKKKEDSAEYAEEILSGYKPLQGCSWCKKVTAQPRFIILREVLSSKMRSDAHEVRGVFCSDCAQNAAIRASFRTWALGWWGLPLGPLLTVTALFGNLFGGRKPKSINFRLLMKQAEAFKAKDKHELARATAEQARKFTDSPVSVSRIESFIKNSKNTKELKNNWHIFNRAFFVQLAPFFALLIVVFSLIYGFSGNEKKKIPVEVTKQEEIRVTDIPSGGLPYQVDAEFLFVRKGPGPHFGIIDRIRKLSTVHITGIIAGSSWVRIQYEGDLTGFVNSKNLVKTTESHSSSEEE